METNNNYFIVNMAEHVLNGDYTLFLNQSELKKVICILNKNKCKYEIYSPYLDAEKVIVYSDIIPDVSLLEILCKLSLSIILSSNFSTLCSSIVEIDIYSLNVFKSIFCSKSLLFITTR